MRVTILALLLAAACGDDTATPIDAGTDGPSEDLYFARCAVPRTGTDPLNGSAYPDMPGSLDDEKRFLRSFVDDVYLWYNEVPANDPKNFATPQAYFAVLKTPKTLPSGQLKDRPEFHFTYPTPVWEGLLTGVSAGYGADFDLLSRSPPREIVIATIEPGSPADQADLARGARILTIDGVDVANGSDVTTLNAGLSPQSLNQTHTFVVQDLGAAAPRTVMLTSATITTTNVKVTKALDTPTGKVGYLVLSDFESGEGQVIAGINQLVAAGVTDLVLDLRYNGGGLLDLSAELGYMIAGPTQTQDKVFEKIHFNDKYPDINPFTGDPPDTTMFWSTSMFDNPKGQALPHLDLPRLFVLTSDGTCSASEAIMNGLQGIDIQVIQIGDTTCGKPYGFYPVDNCGTTYFAIQFQGQNAKGFGDFADGFSPGAATNGETLLGCQVDDDFNHQLGDPAEARLAAALAFRATGSCPAAKTAAAKISAAPAADGFGALVRKPVLESRSPGHPSRYSP